MKMAKKFRSQFKVDEKKKLLQEIQEDFDYHAKKLSADELSLIALKKMSRYARFVKDFQRTANAVMTVGESIDDIHDTPQTEEVAHGFHIGAAVLAVYNFLRIPFMYLSAYLLDQPIPFTLSNNARWLYSAVLLALSITAIAAPVTAPIIAFVSAGIAFAASSFFLAKVLYERYKLAKESDRLDLKIQRAEAELERIHQEAKQLEQSFDELTAKSAIIDACIRTDELKRLHDKQKVRLEKLYDQKLQNTQLKAQFGLSKVLFKSISLILATATIVGLVVSLFFPPVGLGILAGVALVGATYLLGRVLAPVLSSFSEWLKTKWKPTPHESSEDSDKNDLRPEASLQDSQQQKDDAIMAIKPSPTLILAHESTAEVMRELSDNKVEGSGAGREEQAPIASAPLFSIKPSPNKVAPKSKTKQADEDDSETENEGLLPH
ncbi:hypothetical protein [Legionella sp. km772]|uniref:hypothetical protein n=1 Tax=Legionella sp. km772 TaxID=2498111 RepID=UPI000F8D839C|nr:hypothetical protein [Legionella sp. km772]RUR13962.1 hypothetical protein ELY15_00875 [Legionella sp. km772]